MMKKILMMCLSVFILTSCSNKNNKSESDMKSDVSVQSDEMYMLVGTYTSGKSNGIYVYKLDTAKGTSRYISDVVVENPSYLVLDKNEKYVYAVTENEGVESSAVNAFSFDKKDGKLSFLNKELTKGGAPCYINIDDDGKHVITANYLGASVSVFTTKEDGGINPMSQLIEFTGKGLDKNRQTQPHIHSVQYTPDRNYVLVNDLGTDKIHQLKVNRGDTAYLTAANPKEFQVKPGSGPRHLAFHPNGKFMYLITEISGDVIAFDYKDGNLTELQTIKADTLNAQGSADIHVSPDGKFVYASNRLMGDGIAIFSINQTDGKLTKVGYQSTGVHPRNFAITPNGKLLLVACRDSGMIQVFNRNADTGLLEDTGYNIELDMPVCIKFASLD